MIRKIPTRNMSREEWLRVRQNTIGGSDAAALLGMNPYSSPYTVYADKLGLIPPKPDNEAMRQGRDLEEYVARRFCEETGKRVRKDNNIIINSNYEFAHANVDRLIVGEDAGLECKTTSSLNLAKFKDGKYPDNYYVQCMHYMMVTGKSKWYLAVLLFGRDFLIFEIKRDEEEIAALAEAEKIFYYNHILAKEPPGVDGSRSTSETVDSMYPQSSGAEIDLTLWKSDIEEYLTLKAQEKALKGLINEKANVIKDIMKEAERGLCGENKVSWKTQTRGTLDKKALAADHPEIILQHYTHYSTSRVFKIS